MKKVIYLDVETTGMHPIKHDIIQLAAIIEIDGQIVAEENIRCQPSDWNTVSSEALAVSGTTTEQLKTYILPAEAYNRFTTLLNKYVDRYKPEDKFYPAGYNLNFDLGFINSFMKKHNDNYLGSYLNWKRIDPLPLLHFLEYQGKITLPNFKLSTVCEHFSIELQAHDALSDVKATRELLKLLQEKYYPAQ